MERKFGFIDLRGGARLSQDLWHPAGGLGLNLSKRLSLDFAAFGTTANVERERKTAVAASIRLNRGKE